MSDAADTTPLTIIPQLGAVDEISLVATALPLQGVSFPTEQRVKTKYYPGNPVATQQVTGPTKPNTTMNGRWMDLSLGDGGTRLLIRDIEYLCERGIPVEVRWGGRQTPQGEDPPITRRGVIKKFDPKYTRTIHAEWSIEFEWAGSAVQTAPPTFAASLSPSNDLVDFSDSLVDNQEQTQGWIDVAWSVIGRGANEMLVVSDALDDVQNAVADATVLVDGAADLIQQAASLPSNVVDRIRASCSAVIVNCANARAAYDSMAGLWAGLRLTVRDGQEFRDAAAFFAQQVRRAQLSLNPTDDPLDRLDAQTSIYSLVRGWDNTASRSFQISAEYAAKQVPDIIAVVRPPAGSDLRDVAAKYLDGPDDWPIIADFNGLDSSEVPATPTGPSEWGAPPIFVPRKTPQNAALVWSEP